MVTLFCVIVGVEGNAFPVDIDESKSVGHLKKLIREEKPQTITGEADKLELFLAKKGNEWLTNQGVAAVVLDDKGHPVGFDHMNVVGFPLNLVGLSEESIRYEFTEEIVKAKRFPIHVLVVVPTDDTERNAKRTRAEIIDFRQLDELVAIAQSLNGAKVGTLLDTPNEIFGTRLRNGLYIRQEYSDLYDIIEQKLVSDRSISRILVIGSPGIGKSVFGIFLLLLFMLKKKDIAYRPLDSLLMYFSWNDTNGYDVSKTPRRGRIYNGLFDGNASDGAFQFGTSNCAFVFASPRTTNYNEFVKEDCFKVYMNPWNKVECQRLADLISADEDEWLRRYNLVGGKPRFLFSSMEFDDLVARVEKDIPLSLKDLKEQVQLYDKDVFDDRMKHILFNLYRNDARPSLSYLAYSSLVIEVIMSVRFNTESANEIRSLLQTPAPNLQAWRGKELEKFLLQDLATSTFEMRVLEGNRVGAVTSHGPLNATAKTVQTASEIQDLLVLNIPLSKIFPAIDAVLVVPDDRRIIYAQVTVSTAHPIKYQHLKDVYEHLTQRQEFRGYEHILLFVVSNDIYDGFTVQPYKNENGKNRKTRIDINLTQYVGKIIRQ